jgi:hypothetical protein
MELCIVSLSTLYWLDAKQDPGYFDKILISKHVNMLRAVYLKNLL